MAMNARRCTDLDYIQFLVATQKTCSCTEAARVQPESAFAPAHDSFTRLLHRLEPDPETLWAEAVLWPDSDFDAVGALGALVSDP